MKKALAWIATLALLLTSMSGLATVSLTASADQSEYLITDFATGNTTISGWTWDESTQSVYNSWGQSTPEWCISGGAFGTGFSFDYNVPSGEAHIGHGPWNVSFDAYYVRPDGTTGVKPLYWFTLTGSGTYSIELGEVGRIYRLYGWCEESLDTIYIDNLKVTGYDANANPDYVFADFAEDATGVSNLGTWSDGRLSVTGDTYYLNCSFSGSQYGIGFSFDYDVPEGGFGFGGAWGDPNHHLTVNYRTLAGVEKSVDLGNFWVSGKGTKEIYFGEIGQVTGMSGWSAGGTMYVDNFTTIGDIGVRTDRVIYDFDDGVKPAAIGGMNLSVSVENGRLKCVPTAEYNAITMNFEQGSMAGATGITYDYEVPKDTWFNYNTSVTYIGADGAEHTLTEEWGGRSQHGHTGKGTRTIGYSPEVMNGLIYFHMWSNQTPTIYFDNFRTSNARPSLVVKADEVVDSVKVTWDYMDATVTGAEIYTSTSAIDHTAFEAGTATGLTKIYDGAAAGAKEVSGVGGETTLYVAAKFTVLGNAYYVYQQATTQPAVKVLYDFEDEAQANTAWGGGNAMGYAFDADHEGSGMMKIWDDPQWGYGYFTLGGDVGDFAGDAVKFYLSADSTGWGWNCTVLYKDPTDGTNKEAKLWEYGALTRGAYNTLNISGLDLAIRKNIYGFRFNCNDGPNGQVDYGWIDNVCVVNPIDVQAPKANLSFEVNNGALAVKWNVKDDTSAQDKITVAVYAAQNAFTQADLADLADSGITQISTAVSGSYNAGARAYVGVLATDEAGQTSFECKGQSLVCAYETADVLADYARVENGGGREIVAYGGSNALHYYTTGASSYCNTYVLAPVGKLQGDAVQFDIAIDSNGQDQLWMDQAWMMWVDADGNTNVSVIKQYTAEGSGVFSFDLTGLTAEQKAGFVGFRWNWGVRDKAFDIYIDNLRVINPAGSGPEVALTAAETAPQTVTLTKTVGDSAVSSKAYMSLSPINEAKITAFEGGEENGLQVVTGTVLEHLTGGTTYYFALTAADAKGRTGYAFTQVNVSTEGRVLYDWDEKTPSNKAFDAISFSGREVNTDPANAVSGNSLKIVANRLEYPGIHITGNAGDFNAQGFSIALKADIVKDADKATAPSIMLNGYRVWYKDDNGDSQCTYQWVGRTLTSEMTVISFSSFTSGDQAISEEIMAKAYDIELGIQESNWDNGTITLYVDDVKLLNPRESFEDLEEAVAEAEGPFDLSAAELSAATDAGLLTKFEPSVVSTGIGMEGSYKNTLAFNIQNPAQLTKTMEGNGYRLKTIGVVMLPTTLLEGSLNRNTKDALTVYATMKADVDNSGYENYSAVLLNASDYTFYKISVRAFVTYEAEDGNTITLYSHNNDESKDIADGVMSRSLNTVTRLTAQAYYDGGYHGDITFGEGENFLNKKSYETVKAFVEAAYAASKE